MACMIHYITGYQARLHPASLSVILLMLSGCASAPPPDPMESWKNPEFQEQWNRCIREGSGESFCSASFRKSDPMPSGGSLVTEGQFVHKNAPPEKSPGGDGVLLVVTEPEKSAKEKPAKPYVNPDTKKQPPRRETAAKPAKPKQPASQPTPITGTPAPPAQRESITVTPCLDEEKKSSRQIQENIQSLRGSLREWMRSRGDQ